MPLRNTTILVKVVPTAALPGERRHVICAVPLVVDRYAYLGNRIDRKILDRFYICTATVIPVVVQNTA